MASGGLSQVRDSLSCGVCFERYDGSTHLPKMLPCQHTFCSSCIESLKDACVLVDAFECPVCCGQVSSDKIRTNLVVIDIVEAVVADEKAQLFCLKHPAKYCQLVCTDCLQFLCGVCTIKCEHVGHTIDDIDEAKDTMKKRLTTAVETKIANLVKATSTKVNKIKKELAQQEDDINTWLNTVIYMITKTLNEWKKTQLQKTQQAIYNELETSKAQQASLMEKLQPSDLQSIMSACKEVEAKETEVETISFDVSLPKINFDELQDKLTSLCETIQTLIKDNDALPSSQSSPTSSSHKDTDKSDIYWDFIVHLCSSAVPQKDPIKRPYIPPCVKMVANTYNRNRNTKFYLVTHWGKDGLACRTNDFILIYDCSKNKRHTFECLGRPSVIETANIMKMKKNILHDPDYAIVIRNALAVCEEMLADFRNGIPQVDKQLFQSQISAS